MSHLAKSILLLSLFIFASPLYAEADLPASPYYQATETIVILGAVPQEIPVIVDQMTDVQKLDLWGSPYYAGHLHGKPVIVAITGIGETFTAMITTQFIQHFKPRLVLMSGTAARINPALRTGDIIVAESAFEHDYGSLTDEGMVFFPLTGQRNGNEVPNDFRSTPALLEVADKAMADFPEQTVTVDGTTYQTTIQRGKLASSDLFGVPAKRIKRLKDLNVDLMESESAALGLVCENFGVPYLIVRAGSNLAQPVPNDDYKRLGPIAAKEAAKFTAFLVKYL
ncbi:MAG: 5'-methylthioadenosine/S-adenosylhomocysteine nucleosidase [Thiotrichales bacterium]